MEQRLRELYQKIYAENYSGLEKQRKKARNINIFCIMALIVLNGLAYFLSILYFSEEFWFFSMTCSCIIIGYVQTKYTKEAKVYKKYYKEQVIQQLTKGMFNDVEYEPDGMFLEEDFIKSGFDKSFYGQYLSEDLVKLTLNTKLKNNIDFCYAEVHTKDINGRDMDGKQSGYTLFRGLVGKFKISKKFPVKFYIRRNGLLKKTNKNKINMDMTEFEELFDVECEDKNLAVRILTADIMDSMIKIYKKFNHELEVHVIEDVVYVRIKCGALFEPSIRSKSITLKKIQEYYFMIKDVTDMAGKIYDIIDNVDL